MSDALIRLSGVGVSFAGNPVLDNVELELKPGEIVTLIGPNGAGKTTLVRVVLGLLKPDAGRVQRQPQLRIGYMPQKLHVDATLPLTVLRFLRLVPCVDRARAETALAEVGAPQVIDSPLQRISGGELQRVCLCRAIVQEPSVLLLDEPTSALDLSRQMEILKLIRHVVDRHNCATIMTMHDLNLALRFADRFVFMKNGEIYASCDKYGVTPQIIEDVYGIKVEVILHNELPIVVPCE